MLHNPPVKNITKWVFITKCALSIQLLCKLVKNLNFNKAWESYVSSEISLNNVAKNVFLIEGEEGSAVAIANFSIRERSHFIVKPF